MDTGVYFRRALDRQRAFAERNRGKLVGVLNSELLIGRLATATGEEVLYSQLRGTFSKEVFYFNVGRRHLCVDMGLFSGGRNARGIRGG